MSKKSSIRNLRITTEGKVKLPLTIALVVYSIIISCVTGKIVVAAMIMSFFGDMFMLKNGNCFYNKDKDDFKIGVFMFMFSHIVYAGLMKTSMNVIIFLIMMVITTLYAMAMARGVKSKYAVIAFYALVLILSVVNTFNFNMIAFAGGLLFLISDALIGIFDVLKKNNSLLRHVLVWGTYVPAQILLISSFTI